MQHRKKFRRSRVASSENYEQSLRIHRVYLMQCHEQNEQNEQVLNKLVINSSTSQIIVFGKTITINKNEAKEHSTLNIIVR